MAALAATLALGLAVAACQPATTTTQSTPPPTLTSTSSAESSAPSDSTPSATPSVPETLEPMTFVLDWTPNTNHTGIYLALERGYYAEEGIALEIQAPPEDGAEALVAAGRADIGMSFQDSLAPAFARSEPLPITAVAAIINHNTSGIVSLKEKGIDSPAKLEGMRYATWDLPTEQAIIRSVVEADGGDFDKIEMAPTTVLDVISGLQTMVDAVWIFYAWDGVALEVKGIEHHYLDFAALNPVFDYYTPVLIASNKLIDEQPERLRAFLRATRRGYEEAIADPDAAAESLLRQAEGLDAEIVRASQAWLASRYIADAPRWGYMDPARWDGFYTWLSEEGLVEVELAPGTGFSNDYLPE